MSRVLVVFDPADTAMVPGDVESALEVAWGSYLDPSSEDGRRLAPTPSLSRLLRAVSGRYVSADISDDGRRCVFEQPHGVWENAVIFFTEIARRHGLVLIDPQGREPVMTLPGGGGLLDA